MVPLPLQSDDDVANLNEGEQASNDDASILKWLKPQVGEAKLQSLPLDVTIE